MGGKPTPPRQIAIAAAFSLSCFVLILFAWIAFGGSVPLQAQGYRFKVLLPQATSLAQNEQVRIAGVPVGKVVSVTPSNGKTLATLELQRQYAPLSTDAHVLLRSKTLLGENFIQVSPGTRLSPKVPDGGYLSPANVDASQSVDQLLAAFDKPTRDAWQRLFVELGAGFAGRGSDFNSAFGAASPSFQYLNQVLQILNSQSAQLQTLVHDSGVFFNALGAQPAALQGLFTNGDKTFAAIASQSQNFTATFNAFPPFLLALQPLLTTVKQTAAIAKPTLDALLPIAPLVQPALQEVNQLAPAATQGFKSLLPLITAIKADLPALTELVNAARPLLSPADEVLRQFVPFLQLFQQYTSEAIGFVANTGASLEATNASGTHVARVLVPINQTIVIGQDAVSPLNRHNAYPSPGSLNVLATGLAALDCNNTGNTGQATLLDSLGGGSPACVPQAPWRFQGVDRSFPNIQPYDPTSPTG